VAYESHLAPPAHLVGLRVAAFDALLGAPADDEAAAREGQPVVVVSAVALSEKVPDPQLRPHSFNLRVGELIDLDECAEALVGAGYERAEQVEERAVRVELFDIEVESLRWFSTFTQRSLGEVSEVEIAPAAELAVEHRELAEIAAATGAFPGGQARESERADIAELLPLERFGEHDAERLYVNPERIRQSLKQRTRIWISAHSSGQPIELRAQAADSTARSLAEAEPELERLVRSGYRTVVAFPRRGEGERVAYNLARMKATWLEESGERAGPQRVAAQRASRHRRTWAARGAALVYRAADR